MKTLVIHISDIHFKKNNKCSNISEKIISAITSTYSHQELCILLVTGDIAQSGKKDEYVIASSFLKDLKNGLERFCTQLRIIMCPGNHDCNFEDNDSIRDIVLDRIISIQNTIIDEKIIDTLCSVQTEYFEFQDRYQKKENKIFSRNTIDIGDKKILIDSFNVAWMSKLKESQGKLIYPTKLIKEAENSDLRIAIYHHPNNWLESNNAREFDEKLEKTYHLIFTGHEHKEKYLSIVNLNSNNHSTYINGGVLQDHSSKNSSFTTLEIDIDECEFYYKTWKYIEKEDLYKTNEEDCQSISIGSKTLANPSKATTDNNFKIFLRSVEIPFQHPRVTNLTLDKIYIPVHLTSSKKVTNNDSQDSNEKILTTHLHNKIINEKFITILGEPQSGKTTTLKILYENLLKKNFFPIYIQGDSIKKKQKSEIDSIIKLAIKKQYSGPSYDQIIQNQKDRIVILIDSFESSTLNTEAKDEVINYLSQKFNYIALTMGLSSFAASLTRNTESSLLSIFSTYDLAEFSYSARGDLIEAWVKLGQEDSLSEKELDLIVSKKEELLNSLAHSNLLPTLPGHVLLILQYMETGAINPEMNGAYGHIYQTLVTKILSNSNKYSLDILIAYLSNLAFTMYQKGATSLDDQEAYAAHNSYYIFSEIPIDKNEIITTLKNINALKETNESISFTHPYLFYYFVATYIQKRISEAKEIETIISKMISTIYRDDSCNILIFYSHIANQTNIINKILEKIKIEFIDFEICRFDQDTHEISKFYQEMAEIYIQDDNPKKWRKEKNYKLDENKPMQKHQSAIENQSDENATDGLEYKLNSCFRSLDVLGQVLQSNVSSLSGEAKFIAIKEGCNLLLRITSSFNKFIVEKSDEISNDIKSHLVNNKLTEQEKSIVATKFVATITEMIIFSLLKKLSFSLGSNSLKSSFAKLNEIDDCPPSYKLIETMIFLDNSIGFPKNKVESAYEYLKDYHLGKRMLQRLVYFHFLKYRVEYDTKQWATDLLQIKYSASKKNQDPKKLTHKN